MTINQATNPTRKNKKETVRAGTRRLTPAHRPAEHARPVSPHPQMKTVLPSISGKTTAQMTKRKPSCFNPDSP